MEAGFAIPRSNWTEELCGIIYATIDDVIVGSITYQTGNDGLLLLMSGVDTNQRQNGIFKILNVHFENMARRLNRKFIFSTVHVDNKVRLLTAKKTNFNPIYRLITKIL
jgi:hypothetical protein